MPADQTIRYQPALDGLRALAVVAVLLFHGGLTWMSGGYLGVSVFFTLSGFLITSLLLREADDSSGRTERRGQIDIVRFYTRRARRLLPASLLCIVAVCVLAAAGSFDGVTGLRRDVLGALFQVFNWVKLASGESYADLNNLAAGLRHPLDHYWSLSIEEQFYWVWPLSFVALLRLRRRRPRWTMLRSTTVLFAISVIAAPVIAIVWGANAAYWATPARASEILAGAVLACWCQRRTALPGGTRWLAPICLVLLAGACVLFPDGSGPAYRGALPLVAVVSAGLILGLQARGPVRSMLSAKPLVGIGKISYGIYLYHWPVYVLIDRQRWDLPVGVTLAIKGAITLAIALVSYAVVERPIRRARSLPPRRTLVLGIAGMAVVAALVVVVPNPTKFYAVDTAAAQQAAIDTGPVAPLLPTTAAGTATATSTTV
ncbi:MAG: putative acyltransferase, partial [Ilumatobacteraceae bacterium]|nr:putative acyltransferase [Ilumatobacteraceae bacterium]